MKRPEGFVPKPPASQHAPDDGRRRDAKEPQKPSEKTSPLKKPRPKKERVEKPRVEKSVDRKKSDRSSQRAAARDARRAARQRRRYEKDEIRRFTRRSRNRRLGWIIALGLTLGLAGLLAAAVYSPLLALRTITVDGTSRVDPARVKAAIDDQLGTPLALIDHQEIKRQLGTFPLIRSFVTEVVPPGELIIQIVERAPVGSMQTGSGFNLVDPAGIVIEGGAERQPGVPLIDVGGLGTDSAAFEGVVAVLLALPPSIREQVDSASATTRDDVRFVLTGVGQRVVWGSADRSALKARVLDGLMAAQGASARVEYDVSAPLAPVVRPG